MKLRLFLFLAGISCILALPASTARRPRYGGTLRVEIAAALNSLDPAVAAPNPEISSAKDQFVELIGSARADRSSPTSASASPFRIAAWEPAKHATLVANDESAGGHPFVDSIEIQMGRSAKDRLLDLELSKTDLAEIPAEEARRAAERGVRLSTSQPDELIALVFVSARPLAEDSRAREALAQAIDRASIANFILQKEGEPAGGLLPQWSSGTAFLFSTVADPGRAKEQWSRIAGSPKIWLGYDAGDALEQAVAERIAVNAREAGISMSTIATPGSSPVPAKADAKLVRLRMSSSHPRIALTSFLAALDPVAGIDASPLPDSASPGQMFEREQAIVSSRWVVPLVWLPQVYGLGRRVRDWKAPGPGESWPLADVWLDDMGTTAGGAK
jgi:hypothetical protein